MDAKRALVTGGNRGIGRAIATALSGAGHEVTIIGRDIASLEATVAAGQAVRCKTLDVRDGEALRVFAASGSFDILVNNAGGAATAPFHKTDIAAFRAMFALNLESAVAATQGCAPGMVARGFGRVINIASTAGLKGYAYTTAYSAAKHALVGLTRSLAIELVKSGVTVNAICPGFTDTDLVAESVAGIVAKTHRPADEVRAHFESSLPLGRMIQPDEVAEVALWLAEAKGAAVTGQAFVVAGGEL